MGKNVNLKKVSTRAPSNITKQEALVELEKMKTEIIELQQKFYADGRYGLLVVLQGMDASGKDGAVRHVLGGVNPSGIKVYSWKKPVGDEVKHDYLWRLHNKAPEKGMIHVWNRSHYEDILVPTVLKTVDKKVVERRYDHLNNFEQMLTDEGIVIVKCYLHMSKEVQLERLEERLLDPQKYWKSSGPDFDSRALWDEYMNTYESILERTDTDYAPWTIVPVDQKWYKLYVIAKTILKAMKSFDLKWPKLSDEHVPASVRADVEVKRQERAKLKKEKSSTKESSENVTGDQEVTEKKNEKTISKAQKGKTPKAIVVKKTPQVKKEVVPVKKAPVSTGKSAVATSRRPRKQAIIKKPVVLGKSIEK